MTTTNLEQETQALLAIHAQDRRAHFAADAALLLERQGEPFLSVANGQVESVTRAETAAFFSEYFAGATYTAWDDLEPPQVRVADDASLAWMINRYHVRRTQTRSDGPVITREFVYAGLTGYAKEAGRWVRVANVSTFAAST